MFSQHEHKQFAFLSKRMKPFSPQSTPQLFMRIQ